MHNGLPWWPDYRKVLSYGPQAGEMDLLERQNSLQENTLCKENFVHVSIGECHVCTLSLTVGDQEQARKHCEASINILEKLYHPNHIIIAQELIKLAFSFTDDLKFLHQQRWS
ncbi:hypothetical protein GUJ93_ZPchr0012g21017 [Zizania palustris]|uniref:Uncharacterized protein n=1 Tax=Zizania palustris TaxID=103762 RepID=A0A8J5WNY8_ZIZPA|nr:hypothetical protein GUJ93_ZPchr0012g21017 [Zizania palustris]